MLPGTPTVAQPPPPRPGLCLQVADKQSSSLFLQDLQNPMCIYAYVGTYTGVYTHTHTYTTCLNYFYTSNFLPQTKGVERNKQILCCDDQKESSLAHAQPYSSESLSASPDPLLSRQGSSEHHASETSAAAVL